MLLYKILYELNTLNFLKKNESTTLNDYCKNNKNIYIIKAYDRLIKLLVISYKFKENITSSMIDKLLITDNMKNKLKRIIITPTSVEFLRSKNDYKFIKIVKIYIMNKLTDIEGIGVKKAKELIDNGFNSTNMNDLKKKKWSDMLTKTTNLLLDYDIMKEIPYNTIHSLKSKLLYKDLVIIVGGYIRKKPISKDIDVVFINSDKLTDSTDSNNYVNSYLNHLNKHFKTFVYARGPNKISMLIKLKKYIKLDIFITTPKSKIFTILYGVGSKQFNLKMRTVAKRKGYLLNQYGLVKNDKSIKVKNEQEIFKLLDIPYTEYEDRV